MGNTDLSNDLSSSLSTLSSAMDGFNSVARRVEKRLKELEGKEGSLLQLERRISHQNAELAEREKKCKEMEKALIRREKEVEVQLRKMNSSKAQGEVRLNVGGQKFTTSKSTLMQFKGSFFESTILSDDEEYFIDHDPKYFSVVLNFMRDGSIRHHEFNSPFDLANLKEEFLFYSIPFPFTSTSAELKQPPQEKPHDVKFENGQLLHAVLQDVIQTWFPNKRFSLIYKASRDGLTAKDFHSTCDNRGPTLSILQSNDGFLFGGYAPLPWDSSNTFQSHPDTFVFTLTNPHSLPPTKYSLKPNNHKAVQCRTTHGVSFGEGDLFMCTTIHKSDWAQFPSERFSLQTNFPQSFIDTTGKGQLTFTGGKNTIKELEVYTCQ